LFGTFRENFCFHCLQSANKLHGATLMPGDFIFAYRIPFGVKIPLTTTKLAVNPPKRGDIVVFTYPEQPRVTYVKRVVGLAGDRIQIDKGELSINGERLVYESLPEEQAQALLKDFVGSEYFKVVQEKSEKHLRNLLFQSSAKGSQFGPIIVPPGEVFLLGDNRDSSDDSRYWGTVPIERVEGRVQFIWLSLNWQKKVWGNRVPVIRWDRIGTSLH
jgi:signal peptidase I